MRLHPDVSFTDTVDGMVLLHGRSSRYWQLNASGAEVVRQLAEGGGAEEAIERLAARYPSQRDRCVRDTHALLGQLRDAGLVCE